MTVRGRLILLALFLALLVAIGRWATGDFSFLLTQFWFASGFALLLIASLVDQPFYSTDANVLMNAIAGGISLLLVPETQRDATWIVLIALCLYLIASSYLLMWVRRRPLAAENALVRTISRLNRVIGRPKSLFSALLLWGIVLQFGASSAGSSALFLYWALFMLLDIPALARTIDSALSRRNEDTSDLGTVVGAVSPRLVDVEVVAGAPRSLVGMGVQLISGPETLGSGVIIDDRIVLGRRLCRVGITGTGDKWPGLADIDGPTRVVRSDPMADTANLPVSAVDSGSRVGQLQFLVHPDFSLQTGEVLWTETAAGRAYYQVIAATLIDKSLGDDNSGHYVRVQAGELGIWDANDLRFDLTNWLPRAGELVWRSPGPAEERQIPPGSVQVGTVPNSAFPVHVRVAEAVTHNTAIIGVTGSGKSYLAFHLIESMITRGIKVMILDISRQHDIYLAELNPTPLRVPGEVEAWLKSDSMLGVHQFATAAAGFPASTAQFVDAAFKEVAKTPLERGKNIDARLCVVLEEAHSLIPEWNQIAQPGDQQEVNKTARTILQGRKYGMGVLVITQRTANVTKTILNQCNTIFAMQSFDQTGLDFLRNYMGEGYSEAISTMPARHAILVGIASSSARPVLLRVEELTERWTPQENGPVATAANSP